MSTEKIGRDVGEIQDPRQCAVEYGVAVAIAECIVQSVSTGRMLVTWAVLAVLMSGNGIARELGLKRVLAPTAADMASALLGMTLIGIVTYAGFAPLREVRAPIGELGRLSVWLVMLTVAFETVLGRTIDHKTWSEIGEHYALWRGELWPIVLAWLASMPFLWGRAATIASFARPTS